MKRDLILDDFFPRLRTDATTKNENGKKIKRQDKDSRLSEMFAIKRKLLRKFFLDIIEFFDFEGVSAIQRELSRTPLSDISTRINSITITITIIRGGLWKRLNNLNVLR